jgi:hypothetical protein
MKVMANKNEDELLSKIAQAHKRRQSRGVIKKTPVQLANETPVAKRKIFRTPIKKNDFQAEEHSIFISGGIGDVFAVESFLTDEERAEISSIFYATIKKEPIQELFKSLSWPKLKNHVTAWDDFSNFWCFYTLAECASKVSKTGALSKIKQAKDLSILTVFNEVKKGNVKYNGSSFLNQKIARIKKFNLPSNYIVISPYSTDKRLAGRDFVEKDWDKCFEYLNYTKLNGVVINSGNDFIPSGVINLSNKTSVTEAVEILKSAKGYIGVDSWLSVLASKLFIQPYLQVKSVNKHCYSNADCYYAPQTDFSFIVKAIQVPLELKKQKNRNDNMDPIIKKYSSVPFSELSWCNNHGIMYQTDMSTSVDYAKDYYEKYISYEKTEIATKLNEGRTKITEKYCENLLDIGIGSGEFIKESKITVYGFDINEIAVKWLKERGLYVDPYNKMPDVGGLTFWDSLEHIPNPNALLSLVKSKQYVFISIPIFDNLFSLKKSKHYRPNEHYYYFTANGMLKYMKDSGFSVVEIEDFETKAGREDIMTFVFQKN